MGFPFLTAFIIFIIWLAFKLRTAKASYDEKNDAFWQRERAANATPAKDISNLSYLTIPLDKFPLNFSTNPDVLSIEEELVELSTHKLLNLTGMTNAELKLEYGVPNFETMSKVGEDFDRVTVLLNSYAHILIELDRILDAIHVLEYAVGVKTDVSDSYVQLAECYKKQGAFEKLEYLRDQIEHSNLLLKQSILKRIDSDENTEDFTTDDSAESDSM